MTLRELLAGLTSNSKFPMNGVINAGLRMMMPKVEKGKLDPMDYDVLINGERVDIFRIESHATEEGDYGFVNIVTHERLSNGENSETEALSDIASEGRVE